MEELLSAEKMPVLFLGHGSPMNAIENNEFVEGFRKLTGELPVPQAILCISAHWETRGTRVTAAEHPETIHDFGGFPRQLYEIRYPAPGDPLLAGQISDHSGKDEIVPDFHRGLDHGAWSVIIHMYPEADIPVIQLSLDQNKTPGQHYELGRELTWLRRQGVLIIGSGNLVHNLRMIDWDKINVPGFGYDWAVDADEKIKQLITDGNHTGLIQYRKLGRAFDLAIPTPEHFLPLLYILSMTDKNEKISFFNDKPVGGSLTMTSLRIGE